MNFTGLKIHLPLKWTLLKVESNQVTFCYKNWRPLVTDPESFCKIAEAIIEHAMPVFAIEEERYTISNQLITPELRLLVKRFEKSSYCYIDQRGGTRVEFHEDDFYQITTAARLVRQYGAHHRVPA